ncbi:GspE/PulE family protein [Vibrio splendidus]
MSIFTKVASLFEADIDIKDLFSSKSEPEKIAKEVNAARRNSNTRMAEQKRREKTIKKVTDVPENVNLISYPYETSNLKEIPEKGVLTLENGQEEDFIAFKLPNQETEKIYCLLSTEKYTIGSHKNNIANSILMRFTEMGYSQKVERFFAPRGLIAHLYSLHCSNLSDKLDSEVSRLMSLSRTDYVAQFKKMIEEAKLGNVSDIHIEVMEDKCIIRHRIDGILIDIQDIDRDTAERLSSVIYNVVSDVKETTFDPKVPQSSTIKMDVMGEVQKLRVNTTPTFPGGWDIVIRLLVSSSSIVPRLEPLGYSPKQVDMIEEAMSKPNGAIIMAGVTGSGKTTTIASMVTIRREDNTISPESGCQIKIISIEDPPEVDLPITQIPVNVKAAKQRGEEPFAIEMKAALRLDPDIIYVGEVRDSVTAKLLVSASQSGHEVYTTIHAPSGFGIVKRLRSMDVQNDVIGSQDFLSCLIYQSLLPVTCVECSLSYDEFVEYQKQTLNDEGNDEFKIKRFNKLLSRINQVCSSNEIEGLRFISPKGCSNCRDTGVKGRTVVAEVIIPDLTMRSYFESGHDAKAIKHFIDNGGELIIDHAVQKMKDGTVDPRTVEHKLGWITQASNLSNKSKNTNLVASEETNITKEIKQSRDEAESDLFDYIKHKAKKKGFSSESLNIMDNLESIEAFESLLFSKSFQAGNEILGISLESQEELSAIKDTVRSISDYRREKGALNIHHTSNNQTPSDRRSNSTESIVVQMTQKGEPTDDNNE